MATISNPNQTEYRFQFEEETVTSREPTVITNIMSLDEWDLVTLVAKVVHVSDPNFVSANHRSTKLKLVECTLADNTGTLADNTGTIATDVWEDHIPKVHSGNVYRIKEAQIPV